MNTPSLRQLFEGQLIEGRYRMVRLLAEGNFGGVFHSRLELFGESVRDVAVKISKTTGLTREHAMTVFGEAILLAKIYDQIPDAAAREFIVPVHDLGVLAQHESRGFIVMGLICDPSSTEKPRTLGNEISGYAQGMPWQMATAWFSQICTGMAAVHGMNVIHRDLKPDNILLSPSRKIRIVDFGLAAGLNDAGVAEGSVGTYQYMAPETAERGRSDARSDVYSLGIILYEMLTGKHPFRDIRAPSDIEDEHECQQWSFKRRRDMRFSPSCENPQIPQWLDRIVERCLRPIPGERYPSARELLQTLNLGGATPARRDEAWFQATKTLALRHIDEGRGSESNRLMTDLEAELAQFVRSMADRLAFYQEFVDAYAKHPKMTVYLNDCRDKIRDIRQHAGQRP